MSAVPPPETSPPAQPWMERAAIRLNMSGAIAQASVPSASTLAPSV